VARHAQSPPAGRPAVDEDRDGTTRGIVLPLVTAALVCLLATTGVLLFRGSGDDHRAAPGPVGLDVRAPTGSSDLSPVTVEPTASATASARPTRTATASASASASASTTRPPASTAPPATSAPPATPPRPPVNPKEVQVRVVADWGGTGQLQIRNPSAVNTYSWELVVQVKRGGLDVYGDASIRKTGKTYSITGRTSLAPGGTAELWYRADRGTSVSCTLNGASCSLDLG
jgi:hypothetical protein